MSFSTRLAEAMKPKVTVEQLVATIRREGERLIKVAETDSVHQAGSALLGALRLYELGQKGEIPEEWLRFAKQAEQEADPEYQEYLRLQNKFK
jgi:N-glycosylase/DNA lyase